MAQHASRCLSATVLVAVALCLGCGQRRYPVSGKVRFDNGTPYVAGGFVALEKGDGKDRVLVRAAIQEDGSFRTQDRNGGAVAGRYQVRLIPPPPESPAAEVDLDVPFGKAPNRPIPPPKPAPFDKKFLNFDTSGLEWTVKSGTNEFEIDLGSPGIK